MEDASRVYKLPQESRPSAGTERVNEYWLAARSTLRSETSFNGIRIIYSHTLYKPATYNVRHMTFIYIYLLYIHT